MTRYIDADKMREDWLKNGKNECIYDANDVIGNIDSQPTADVVEVVRCKDCRLAKEDILLDGFYHCENNGLSHRADHFCGYGERKVE